MTQPFADDVKLFLVRSAVICATGSVVGTHTLSYGLVCVCVRVQGVLVFVICGSMCVWCHSQDDRYEEEDLVEERILGSSFSPGRNTEVFELPDLEALFMPSNMDNSQMAFKFKEVSSWDLLCTYLTSDSKLLPVIFILLFYCFKCDPCLMFLLTAAEHLPTFEPTPFSKLFLGVNIICVELLVFAYDVVKQHHNFCDIRQTIYPSRWTRYLNIWFISTSKGALTLICLF